MLPLWRRFRFGATLLFSVVGIGLLYLARAAPFSVNGEARAMLGFLGIILPIGFYAVLTVSGWAKSAAAGVTPPPVMARLLKLGVAPGLPLAFLFVLMGLTYQLTQALEHPRAAADDATVAADNFRFLNNACIADAGKNARAAGRDPDSAEVKPRIAKYCGCVATQVPLQFTPAAFKQVLDHTAPAEQTQKFSQLTTRCEREVGG